MSVNKVILVGNLGRDPEVRHLPTGMKVANFSLATSMKRKTGETDRMAQYRRIRPPRRPRREISAQG